MLLQPVCLEQGVSYTIRVDFTHYGGREHLKGASVLLDSVSLEKWGPGIFCKEIHNFLEEALDHHTLSLFHSFPFLLSWS